MWLDGVLTVALCLIGGRLILPYIWLGYNYSLRCEGLHVASATITHAVFGCWYNICLPGSHLNAQGTSEQQQDTTCIVSRSRDAQDYRGL
jgi:hypothetical protein